MVLQKYESNEVWIKMEWKCAFIAQWQNILSVTSELLSDFTTPEVKAGELGGGGRRINPNEPSVRQSEESLLVIRGDSNHFKSKLSIAFQTKTQNISVLAPVSLLSGYGVPLNYEELAKLFGLYMDIIELKMYTAR